MTGPLRRLVGYGLALALLTEFALALIWPRDLRISRETLIDIFVALLFASVLVYFGAVRLVLRQPIGRGGLPVVLVGALLLRLLLLPGPALLSSDIYRYVWDGRVQNAGINPYRFVPADPALARFRDDAIYSGINRKDYARTIYPPAAQIVFAAVGWLDPTLVGMKIAMMLFEALGIVSMIAILRLIDLPTERVLIYAWNPLTLWSFGSDGHVDAIAIGFLGVALLLRVTGRYGTAGVALAAAALTKFIPIVVAPAFVRGGPFWRPALAGAATIVVLYAIYASAGSHVLGFLSGYGREEDLASGNGFWLLACLKRLVALPDWAPAAYVGIVAVVYLAISWTMMRGKASSDRREAAIVLCRDAAILAAFATAALSPHYAWYLPWIALPCVVAPVPAAVWLSSAGVLLYAASNHDAVLWPSLLYGPAILLAGFSTVRRRRAGPV